MRKKWIGILGTAIALSILLCGCGIIGALSSDNAGGGEFDGAHMKATYDPANWTARTQEIGEGNTAVELLYWDGSVGQMSMAACDMTNEEVEHLYEDLLWQDELLGDIQEEEQQNSVSLHFSLEEEKEYYLGLENQLIKLLYLIEDEKAGKNSADLYFYGFIYELKNANLLCQNKLTKVCVKIFGLYNNSQ